MRSLLAILGLMAVVNTLGFSNQATRYLPGELVKNDPQQTSTSDHPFRIGDYLVTPVAQYQISGRVVARNSYWLGREAELSPIDVGLAWGLVSDQATVDRMQFNLSLRYLRWASSDLAEMRNAIDSHLSNNHLIPATPEIAEQLKEISVGQVVTLYGKLVNIDATDGWSWHTSTSRTDSGPGACEVLYVERIERPFLPSTLREDL